MPEVAILGAGQGGCTLAADLTLKGHKVHLFNRTKERIGAIERNGGIDISGVAGEGKGLPALLTTEISRAIDGVETIFVPVPAYGQRFLANACAPHLRAGQRLILTPGYGGTMELYKIFKAKMISGIVVAETVTLPYGCRFLGPASVIINNFFVPKIAALPSRDNGDIVDIVKTYVDVRGGTNVLEVAIRNPNLIIHPPPVLLNLGCLERNEGMFNVYDEGMSPSVLKCMEALDREVMSLTSAIGGKPIRIEDLYEEFGCGLVYRMDLSSETKGKEWRFQERFITEDIPYGLVFLESLCEKLRVSCPVTSALINVADSIHSTNYRKEGRNLKNLGIHVESRDQLLRFVEQGN